MSYRDAIASRTFTTTTSTDCNRKLRRPVAAASVVVTFASMADSPFATQVVNPSVDIDQVVVPLVQLPSITSIALCLDRTY